MTGFLVLHTTVLLWTIPRIQDCFWGNFELASWIFYPSFPRLAHTSARAAGPLIIIIFSISPLLLRLPPFDGRLSLERTPSSFCLASATFYCLSNMGEVGTALTMFLPHRHSLSQPTTDPLLGSDPSTRDRPFFSAEDSLTLSGLAWVPSFCGDSKTVFP